ncbi:MAG: helix-turn-helix domain-containing protein [Bacteroidetes bacterium]|nr:helix-turn-helix domain-containing protein [Bacteroidota bacterium]
MNQQKENVLLSVIGENDLKVIIEDAVRKIMLELKENTSEGEVDEWLTSQQVCKLLHISKSTLVNYRKKNLITSHKLEGRLLFSHTEILSKIKKLRQFKSVEESMN